MSTIYLSGSYLELSEKVAANLIMKGVFELTPEDLVEYDNNIALKTASKVIECLFPFDYISKVFCRNDGLYVAQLKMPD